MARNLQKAEDAGKELDQKTQWKKVASIQGGRLQDAAKRAGLPVS